MNQPRQRILDPLERHSEVLFGLFMVLTFTGTLSVASAGREDVRTMLLAAIGCNVAWGIVDGVMYLLHNIVTQGRTFTLGRTLRETASAEEGRRLIAGEIGSLAAALDEGQLERIRQAVIDTPPPTRNPAHPTAENLKGALAVFLLVFASTFPVVLPFLFFTDLRLAMRVSAVIAIAMMFRCGFVWGRYAGGVAWRAGLAMVALGVAVEAMIITLGG